MQAIWDTQNDKPVFAMQDARLLKALYQQREHSRRRLFKQQFAPMYGAALLLVVLGVVFVTFRSRSRFTHHGFPMSAWDYMGFAVAAGALLAIVVPMFGERKKHEQTQEIFAPSLREELDRGIAQLDFEIGLHSNPRVMRVLTLLSIIAVIVNWEGGRLSGDPTPWRLALVALFFVLLGGRGGLAAWKKVMERALESMRAALDGDRSSLTTEIGKDI